MSAICLNDCVSRVEIAADLDMESVRRRRLREVERMARGISGEASPLLLSIQKSLLRGVNGAESTSGFQGTEVECVSEADRGFITDLRSAGERCQGVLDRLLKVAAKLGEYGRTAFLPGEPVSHIEDAARCAGLLTRLDEGNGAVFSLDVPSFPPVAMEMGDLVQILVNLMLNSMEAAETDRDCLCRVLVEARRRDFDTVSLAVHDHGPGFPSHLAERLFEPGFSFERTSSAEGLGLSVSKYLTEQAGGSIAVSSMKGRTSAVIQLPLAM